MKAKGIAIAVVIIIVIASFIYLMVKVGNLKDDLQIKNVELSVLKDTVTVYKQKNGELSFGINVVQIEKDNLKKSLDIAGFDIKDLKDQNIKWRKINNALKLELQSVGSGATNLKDTIIITEVVPGITDTLYLKQFDWTNKYLALRGSISDSLRFTYKYKTGIDIIQTSLNKKTTLINAKLTDPNASIISGNGITIKHKTKWYEKWWVHDLFGLTAGILITR